MTPTVTVEFFGIPRAKAGRRELQVTAATVAEALIATARECPALKDLVLANQQLAPHYLVSLDGRLFIRELSHPLNAGDRLLLLSADAGG